MTNILRVSTAADGTQGNNLSGYHSPISADGRYVAFSSTATNLVAGDDAVADVFVKDLQTGAITRVSTSADGRSGNQGSYYSSISADGQHVAFESAASNLVPGDVANTYDVFVKDVHTGAITRTATGVPAIGASVHSSISADGGSVVFASPGNLVAGDTNDFWDVYIQDLGTGELRLVNVDAAGAQGNGYGDYPSISASGRYVAFDSFASDLVAGDTNGRVDILVKDLQTGAVARVSTSAHGAQANDHSTQASISADGRYVAFASDASNLVADDTNGLTDIFVKDLQTGAIIRATTGADGTQANADSTHASISADGRYVAFASNASNLVSGDTNGVTDIFVKDLQSGAIIRLSTADNGAQGNHPSVDPFLSADGHFVAFNSSSSNLVAGDTNARSDIFRAKVDFDALSQGDGANNHLVGGADDDTLIGYAGADTLEGNGGQDVLLGGEDRDVLLGGSGADTLDGGTGNDRLHGGNGADHLVGGRGHDTLIGGLGRDTLEGGIGHDLFVVNADNSPFGGGDTIADFASGEDRIDLRAVNVHLFVGAAAFTGGDGVIEARIDLSSQQLQADLNDDGIFDAGDLQIHGIHAIAAADLLLA
ncbi:MAG: PD40 domain-containing protein [Rhodospirillales bacterium]|nr:PD40 domain-containing protein [Rhodospirillales bacterium]